MVKTMAKLRMAHASTHGARKPPGPIEHRMEYALGQTNGKDDILLTPLPAIPDCSYATAVVTVVTHRE